MCQTVIFRKTGNVGRKSGSGPSIRTPEIVRRARDVIENESKTSLCHLSQQMEVPLGTCYVILLQFKSYFQMNYQNIYSSVTGS
jgi:hypothetical protein